MASCLQRLRLCDPNRKKLPVIKEQFRKKVPTHWSGLTVTALKRIQSPSDAYSKELSEGNYPESSEHIRRLLTIQSNGKKDTTLIDNPMLLTSIIERLKILEDCERNGSSTTEAINVLNGFSVEIAETSKLVAKELFQITLDKISICSSIDDLLKNKVRFLFGQLLVELKEYHAANVVLKEALDDSEKNNIKELIWRICKVYYDSLYNMSLQSVAINNELAIQSANDAKEVALKMNDASATAMSLIQHGNILFSMEKYEEAINEFQSAANTLKKMFNLDIKLEILYKLSTCYFITNNYDSCLLSLGALGRLSTVYKVPVYQAHFYRIEGNLKLLMRQNEIARRNFMKSTKIYDELGLHQFGKRCRYWEAIAECEFLMDPWINILIECEKERDFESRYDLRKAKVSIFSWKLKREYFCATMDY